MKVRSFPASSHCYARNVGESTAHSLVDRMHRCATILDDMARLSFYDSLGSRPLHLMNSVGDGSLQRVRRVSVDPATVSPAREKCRPRPHHGQAPRLARAKTCLTAPAEPRFGPTIRGARPAD